MPDTLALYERIVGDGWSQIAQPIRALHRTHQIVCARGRLRVEHGRNLLARMLVRMLRLPRANQAADVCLNIAAADGAETWRRAFDGRRFETRQYESSSSDLAERFGLLEFRYGLRPSNGSLVYTQREAAVCLGAVRVRIPEGLAPRVEAREDPAGPREVDVHVRVALPGVGPLIAYDGTVNVEGGAS